MRRATAAALLLALLLTGCSGRAEKRILTAEERTLLYETAVTAVRDQETGQARPPVTSGGDIDAGAAFDLLGVFPADMAAYALSVPQMNARAYAVAAIYPAAGKEGTVLEKLRAFIERQKLVFRQYLADQYEAAANARLETLRDGTVLLVMCEDQDRVFSTVRAVIEKG